MCLGGHSFVFMRIPQEVGVEARFLGGLLCVHLHTNVRCKEGNSSKVTERAWVYEGLLRSLHVWLAACMYATKCSSCLLCVGSVTAQLCVLGCIPFGAVFLFFCVWIMYVCMYVCVCACVSMCLP